jgi:hypothetical protein
MNIDKYIKNKIKSNAEFMKLFLKIEPNLSYKDYIKEKQERHAELIKYCELGHIEDDYYADHQPDVMRQRELDGMADCVEHQLSLE